MDSGSPISAFKGALPEFALPRRAYMDPAVFQDEVRAFLAHQWIAACHVSELPTAGDFVTFEPFGYSVVIVRQADGGLAAFHNFCRHRGARVCEAERGHAALLRCRYHGWTYRLDGSLIAWRHMREGLAREDYGLKRCGVATLCGMVFVSMEPDRAPPFDELTAHVHAHWDRYALEDCKVAATAVYTVAANWKLGIENNLECYHCLPSHPEYTAANAFVRSDERVTQADVDSFSEYFAAWAAQRARAGLVAGGTPHVTVGGQICRAGSWPLKAGYATASEEGRPVAPLLGDITEYDESMSGGCVGFLSYIGAMSDYGLSITYVPKSVESTDVVLRWLVRGDAREGIDYDVDRVRWLWNETTRQDKDLIELNASGVRSPAFEPGPYSELESGTRDFIRRYLELMRKAST